MTTPNTPEKQVTKPIGPLASFIFMRRWLQLPLYLGLILAQCVYGYHSGVELSDLIGVVTISSLLIMVIVVGYETFKTFINARAHDEKPLLAQTGIHLAFLASALTVAYSDRIMLQTLNADRNEH